MITDLPAYMRAWRKANPKRVAAHRRRFRAQNTEKLKAKFQIWLGTNREKHRIDNRRNSARRIADLSDCYLRVLLAASTETLKPKNIPESLVAAYRDYLKLKRLCRKLQTSSNSAKTLSTPTNH